MVSIAAISGDCAGGGAELGWACDLRVASASARFAQMEVPAGVDPNHPFFAGLLVMRWPGVIAADTVCAAYVHHFLDICATVTAWTAGIKSSR